MASFRFFPEVQSRVETYAQQGLSKRAIHNALKQEFGRSYRDVDLMADLRRIKERPAPTPEARARAIPRKFRKEPEHLLIILKARTGVGKEVRLDRSRLGVKKEILEVYRQAWQGLAGKSRHVYFYLNFQLGPQSEMEQQQVMERGEEGYQDSLLLSIRQEKEILTVLTRSLLGFGSTLKDFRSDLAHTTGFTQSVEYRSFVGQLV